MSPKHAEQVDFVLAVYDGVIIGVFKPEKWEEVDEPTTKDNKRHTVRFTGYEVKDPKIIKR